MNWTEEQLQAIHKDKSNIIVSAGAGSGKTAVLSERVLRKVKDGIPIDRLLILTFTKAAAGEMKERIRKKLIENNYKEEAEKIDASYITTFDSYALSIVKRYHYLFNISKDIQIIDQNLILMKKKEIIDQVFESLYESQNPKFLKLIDDFCTKDDNEIKTSILEINNKLDLRYDKEIYLKNLITNYDQKLDDFIKEYTIILLEKIEEIKTEFLLVKDLTEDSYFNKLNEKLNVLFNASSYIQIKESIPEKLPTLPRNSEEELKTKKNKINELLKELCELTKYKNEDHMKQEIISTRDYAEIICNIVLEMTDKLKKYKMQTNQFEFIDISKMAIEILEKNSDIRQELKHSYQEILLDEYQDTNDLQEQFISMIENENVYTVGDIKQSIYRFRNANPYIFKTKYDEYSKNNGGVKIDLNQNFRSRKEVLQNINLVFNYIMDQNIGSADYRNTHQMIYGNKIYDNDHIDNQNNDFQILRYDFDTNSNYTKEEIEIFIVARDIQNKIDNKYKIFDKDNKITRDITYRDCVILLDRSTNFTLYKKIFEYLKIPLTIYQDEKMTNKKDINIIKNILNLLIKQRNKEINEKYKYYYISIARSYLFQIPDKEIFKTIKNNNYEDTIIITKINKILSKIDDFTLKQLLETIIDEFSFYENLIKVGDIESSIIGIEYLLKLSHQLGNQGYQIETFTEYLNQIVDNEYEIKYSIDKSVGDSVKIMTIHGSKGLEFPLCYYSGLYKNFNIKETKGYFNYDDHYGLILPIYNEGINTTIMPTLFKHRYIKEEISEKIRLFYVGLTRAKEKMIFVLPQQEISVKIDKIVPDFIRLKYRSFADIINSISEILKPYEEEIEIEKLKISKDYSLINKIDYREKIENISKTIDIEEFNYMVNKKNKKTFSKKKTVLYTKKQYENIKKGKEEHERLEYQIENKKLQNHFKEKPIKIYHEYEFMYEEENNIYHGIIDLILEYEDHIKIIDYKLNNIDDLDYLKQLSGYQKYIEKITSKKTEIYLYSIIFDELKKLEEVVM